MHTRVNAQTLATNPIIWADVPDPDIIRVGSTYYMTSTTMHFNPGVPIMKSTDLVTWRTIGYVYDVLANNNNTNLLNGVNMYGKGSWASCLRYANGYYYVYFLSYTTNATHVYRTTDIENGPWTGYTISRGMHDLSVLFDDDGKVYSVYGGTDIRLVELTADGLAIKSGGVDKIIIPNAGSVAGTSFIVNAEGAHIYKINGTYFITLISWPSGSSRTELVYRSNNLTGTWEGKVVLSNNGVAQGGIVSTPEGKWYGLLFRDNGSVGRIPYLTQVTWTNNWPMMTAPATLDIPANTIGISGIVTSDDFNYSAPVKLHTAWQWNHNPQNTYWSMTARPGYFRSTTDRVDADIKLTRNTLTQRTYGPTCSGVVSVDVTNMKDGDYAGLSMFQDKYGFVGVKMVGTTKSIVMVNASSGSMVEVASAPLNQNTVYFRIDGNFQNQTDKATFYYSLNGTTWTAIGNTLQMSFELTHFVGYRFALFNYATKSAGGFVDFDYFKIGSSITNLLPFASTAAPIVSLTAPTINQTYTAPVTVAIAATASAGTGKTISKVEFYNGTTKLSEDATSPYTYSWTNVAAGTYSITAVATDNTGGKTTSTAVSIKVNVPKGPYGGTTPSIPGKIEFENYDVGGNGVGYFDNTPGTSVPTPPAFRTDEDVDIETCTDAGGGYNIGYATAGEWLEYSVNVATAGTYNITLRVAVDGTGRTISMSAKGVAIATNVAIPSTGGWQTWQDVVIPNITLTAGTQVIRVTIGATDYVNLNYMTFAAANTPAPTVTTPVTYCQGATATALTATGTALKWYTVATGGTASATAPTPSTTTVGSTTYYVSQTLNGLESSRSSIIVTINAIPLVPVVNSLQEYLLLSPTSPLTATGTNLRWYTVSSGGTAITSAPTPSTVSVGTTFYYVSQTVNGCESSRAQITVIVSQPIVSMQLHTGWNMIGCPLEGTTNMQQALSSIWSQVETVKDQDAFWDIKNVPALNSLSTVTWGKGYLVKVKTNCTLDWIVR